MALGLPLLKEKPLGRTLEEAQDFLTRARTAGCPVQTAIQRRHHPSYSRLLALVRERRLQIHEAHAHMHLGFDLTASGASGWRSSRRHAGGGALLDSGYHMVDLLHSLLGPFELVSVALWRNGAPLAGDDVDDQTWLLGRTASCWIYVDSYVGGAKSEKVVISTDQGLFSANRQGVWHEQTLIEDFDGSWTRAMISQLRCFADNIRQDNWSAPMIWDQLPAMQLIDSADSMASRY